jgi:hypothetical protein
MDIKDSSVLIKVPELGGIIRAFIPQKMVLEASQHVTIGIRPEYIKLREQAGDNTFLCTVDRMVDGVTAVNYYFHVNTVQSSRHYILAILSREDSSLIRQDGSSYLYLPPEHVVIITD